MAENYKLVSESEDSLSSLVQRAPGPIPDRIRDQILKNPTIHPPNMWVAGLKTRRYGYGSHQLLTMHILTVLSEIRCKMTRATKLPPDVKFLPEFYTTYTGNVSISYLHMV